MTQPSILCPNRFLLLLLLFLLGSSFAQAQGEPRFESLLVEVWPEFDRPETLIIYRGQLSAETPLPATLSFLLPGYIEDMNAVAYAEDNTLIAVPTEDIEQTYQNDRLRLTFTTGSTTIQLEYYDSQILSRQGDGRTINYSFTAPYAIETTTFEFQEPVQADNFSLEPAATKTFTDANGLTYKIYNVANLAPGDTASFQASYQRSTSQVSTEFLMADTVLEDGEAALPPLALTTTSPAATMANQIFAYVLVGVGFCLLLGVGVIWWLDRQQAPNQDQTLRDSARIETQPRDPTAAQSTAPGTEFCYNCGIKLRPEANFCHKCGSPRRA